MTGVTTAIVGFIFVCIVYPHIVKNRPQFYMAFVAVLLVILFDAAAHMVMPADGTRSAFGTFAYVVCAFLQIVAIILLTLSAGGLTVRELAGEMADAYDVIRRGETEKQTIIPLSGQRPRGQGAVTTDEDEGRVVYQIDPANLAEQKATKAPEPGSIPLE